MKTKTIMMMISEALKIREQATHLSIIHFGLRTLFIMEPSYSSVSRCQPDPQRKMYIYLSVYRLSITWSYIKFTCYIPCLAAWICSNIYLLFRGRNFRKQFPSFIVKSLGRQEMRGRESRCAALLYVQCAYRASKYQKQVVRNTNERKGLTVAFPSSF